jgi:hypothetical protein
VNDLNGADPDLYLGIVTEEATSKKGGEMSLAVFGYIDPGAGSLLLQMLAAGLLSFAFALRLGWSYIKARLCRTPSTPDENGRKNDDPIG